MSNERTINAFPARVNEERISGQEPYTDPGMSLRDYFAAKALVGLMFDTNGENRMTTPTAQASPSELATMSYQIADAMISARAHV